MSAECEKLFRTSTGFGGFLQPVRPLKHLGHHQVRLRVARVDARRFVAPAHECANLVHRKRKPRQQLARRGMVRVQLHGPLQLVERLGKLASLGVRTSLDVVLGGSHLSILSPRRAIPRILCLLTFFRSGLQSN